MRCPTQEQINNVHEMFNDYFGLCVPNEVVLEMINEDEDLMQEVLDEAVRDTAARGYFIGTLTKKAGLETQWPCYGDSQEYAAAFYKEFGDALVKLGGKLRE